MSESLEKKRKLDDDKPEAPAPQDVPPESETAEAEEKAEPEADRVQAMTNDDGEPYYELSNKKRVTVRKWRGNIMVDLREYYEKGDKQLPGKKGLSLTLDQYKTLRDLIKTGALDENIKEAGGDL